jgi:hypothetical protein
MGLAYQYECRCRVLNHPVNSDIHIALRLRMQLYDSRELSKPTSAQDARSAHALLNIPQGPRSN